MATRTALAADDLGTSLLERDEQLAALEAALAMVAKRRVGGLAFVAGEAGVGKTQLVRCFCERARGARVLRAACDPLSSPRPLGPLFDVAEDVGGELLAQVSAGAQPHEVASALKHELAGPSPAVLVLEDAQWADEATLDVIRLVARRLESVPAMLLVTYRDEQVPRQHPLRLLLGELPSGGPLTRIELPTLSRAAVATLAGESEVDVDELYARTAGNPFFVTEVLAAQPARIPHSVRDAVLARAARLSPDAQALLDAVAIVPQRAELWLLEALGALTGSALEDCLVSGMLRADGPGVVFRHELARLAIEESLPPDRAVELHSAALAALAEPPPAGRTCAARTPCGGRRGHRRRCCASPRPPRSTRRRWAPTARPRPSTPARCATPTTSRPRNAPRCSRASRTRRTSPTCALRRSRRSRRPRRSIARAATVAASAGRSSSSRGSSTVRGGGPRPPRPSNRHSPC